MFEKDISKKIADLLLLACKDIFQEKFSGLPFPSDTEGTLQPAREAKHGDLTSNIVMRLSKAVHLSPKEFGELIIERFNKKLQESPLCNLIGSFELEGGFINLRLSDKYYHQVVTNISRYGKSYGKNSTGHGQRVNLEYVSANPTGPLTIAHGRQAAIGDALSRILRFNGFDVTNEYYLNDIGRQIKLLAKSVEMRYRELFGEHVAMPEDGYVGEYVIDIAKEIRAQKGSSALKKSSDTDGFFRECAVKYIMKLIIKDLSDFGVVFDVWTSQAKIEKRKEVEKALGLLEKNGYIYMNEGAKWFASSRLGDDKDRVVVKSDGSFTYLAPDVAYHLDKYRRKYTRLIDLLGPDHHGYINRMKAAVKALGQDASSLDILIVQLVTLFRNGQAVSMSTRKAEFISLREIMDEIGKDVSRFFFLSRRLDSHLNFDIALAKKESQDNPVYYIQYAHARICSIKRFSRKAALRLLFTKKDLNLLKTPQEKELMRKLSEFPFAVKISADTLEPNKLIVYLNELARSFHSFYTECRVVSDDIRLSKTRLFLVECVRIVLANGLGLLNITLPEKM